MSRSGLVAVDRRVGAKNSKDDAGRSQRSGHLDVETHRSQLGSRGNEIAGPRANQHVDGNHQPPASLGDHPGTWRGAADRQVVAKLDAVGTPLLCREADSRSPTQISTMIFSRMRLDSV